MNQYAATIETDDDELNRVTVEYDALSASADQAAALIEAVKNHRDAVAALLKRKKVKIKVTDSDDFSYLVADVAVTNAIFQIELKD
jgi:hypothetical protein